MTCRTGVLWATFVVTILPGRAQTAFEVASVKPRSPDGRGMNIQIAPGGRFAATNASLRLLLKTAYGMRDFQISGAPAWFDSDRYDIVAKAESEPNVSEARIRLMLQGLLADRFKLELRREKKEMTVYSMVIGKNGSKLKEVKPDGDDMNRGVRLKGIGRVTGVTASTSQLAEALSDIALNGEHIVDRPVIDRTGLTGTYDFTLAWTPEHGGASPELSGPSIFTAVQEQLGLRLVEQKSPVEIFVIDHVAKASVN